MDYNPEITKKLGKGRKIMNKKSLWLALFVAVLTLCLSGLTAAQEITGSIIGTVRDSNGAAVPNATVKISEPSKGNQVVRTLVTNGDGEFSAPNLAVSTYSVTVEAPSFKKSVNAGVKLDVGQRRTIDVELAAGKIDETVTVQADALSVDLASATSGTVISGDQVKELSVNNRNFVQLVTLAPGVSNNLDDFVTTGTTTPETGAVATVQISVNGARSSQNTFTVDGADVTDRGSNLTIQAYPSLDSIGEFKVLRSLYPAESGRSGGGQINVVTRAGTSKIHGSGFEFIRNEAFNANDYITNSNPNLASSLGRKCPEGKVFGTAAISRSDCNIQRRAFRYNNFGWTLGGPVYFLRFGERDPGESMWKRYEKTFFFFSQEYRKDKRGPLFTSSVPSLGLRQGLFTVPVCLQATGATCSLVLPANTPFTSVRPINPVAQQYINFIYNKLPQPDTAAAFTLNFPIQSTLDFRQEVVKIDHTFSDKWGASYRYQRDNIPTEDGNSIFGSGSSLPGVSTLSTNSPGRTHTIQSTYAISSHLIVEGRYTYGYGAILDRNVGTLALANSPITPPLAYAKTNDRVPSLTGNGFSGLVGQGLYNNFSYKKNISGSVTWIVGNHTMKFGAVYSKYRKNENAIAGNNEGLFNGFNTPGGTASVLPTGGNATQQLWANFLSGTNVTFTQASFDYTADLRQQAFEGFAQDEWKVARNLTVSAGLRYSYFGSPYDKNGRLTNFVPELWSAANAPSVTGGGNRVSGTGNYCNGLIANTGSTVPAFLNCTPAASPFGKYIMETNKTDFAPRIGLAWDPFGKGTTAVRTGYGIYHEQVLNGMILTIIGVNPPFQQNCQVVGTSLDNAVPAGGCAVIASNTAPNIRAIDPHWKTPYMQQWSLDVQHQITKSTIASVGYYGSKGTHLIGGYELNLLQPGAAIARGATGCATGATFFGSPTAVLGPCQVAGQAFISSASEAILDQVRPYRGYRSITIIQPRYNSSYHSMQVSATHRFTKESQVQLAYTYAKNLTDAQNDRSTSPQNTSDIRTEKGRAALDRRQILTINYIYELPFFRKQNGLVGKTLGGWQVSGIATYQTGLPFTPTVSGFDPAGLGLIPPPLTVARPNLTCDPNKGAPHTRDQWFNTSCFQLTPLVTAVSNNNVGGGGRGIVNGPPTTRFDLTLSKNIRFGENFRVQLRAEGYNIFNKVNFRNLNVGVWNTTTAPVASGGACTSGCSAFGSISSVRDPRVIQLAAKFSF